MASEAAVDSRVAPSGPPREIPDRVTKWLLGWGVIAGPWYIIVGLVQALTREGFDIRRHPLSLLSNGDLGWVQVTNFVVAGLMVTACAVGMRRVLRPGRGGTWGPLLVGGYGLGLVASGIFRPDPADGFPPGTPPGLPEAVSLHGLLHFASGGVAFLALIAACFVFARRFGKLGERGWAVYSAMTGLIFFIAFAGIASGPGRPWLNVAFGVAVVLTWAWLAGTAWRLLREVAARSPGL